MGTPIQEPKFEAAAAPALERRGSLLPMLVLAGAAALAVVTPFFFLGNASGHDFEFHLASWMEVARLWRAGILYPRWAELANWGYGEPRFIFYPPASWMLGTALSFVLPWSMVPGAFIWLALTLAGVSMFKLAREWLSIKDAMAAGLLFVLNPYHLLLAYWRSDFAELLASALVPLAILLALRMSTEPRRAWVPLALLTAAFWLCNAPAAVVLSYTIALILLVVAVWERSARPLIYGGLALGLGLALVAFYIVPAAVEQSWVNISEVLSQGLKFAENFLFTVTPDAEHTRFNFIVSWAAVVTIAATVAAMVGTGRWWRKDSRLWWVLVATVVASIILMLPVTSPLWTYLPKLRYVQFPWRWLLVLDVPFAFCLAAAMGRLRETARHVAWAMALAGLAVTGFLLTRGNWWDPGGAADFYEEHFSSGTGYFGVDEYGPRGSDHYDLDQQAPLVGFVDVKNGSAGSQARAEVQQWAPLRKHFIVHSAQPVTVALRLLNYPSWRVQVNDKSLAAFSDPQTGQMLIALPGGSSRVQVTFATTPDRRWGDAISAVAALAMVVAGLVSLRRRPPGSGLRQV